MAASEKSPEDSPSVQGKLVAIPSTYRPAAEKHFEHNKSSSECRIHRSTDDSSYTISAARSPLPVHVTSGSNHHLLLKVQTMEALISSMFSTVSSLKNAYLQLQSAHVPYDRLKIQIADKAIVQELRRMSELKRSHKENMAAIHTSSFSSSSSSSSSSCLFQDDPDAPGDAKARHPEMSKQNSLKGDFRSVDDVPTRTAVKKKERLERRVKQAEVRRLQHSSNGSSAPWIQMIPAALTSSSPTPELLEEAVLMASESSRSFAKILISLMKAANWDIAAAAEAIEAGVSYRRRSHTKFALESYVNHRMLNGFEDGASFDGEGAGVSQSREKCWREFKEVLQEAEDPLVRLEADPQGSFATYCRNKFLDVVHPKMEESFFGDLSHRKQMDQGSHPRSHLYGSFLSLAKSMWMLHKLAFSFHPPARIFAAEKGVDFTPLYMESIVQSMGIHSRAGSAKVAFTVMPGFRVQKTIIKCQVYVHKAHISESGGEGRGR